MKALDLLCKVYTIRSIPDGGGDIRDGKFLHGLSSIHNKVVTNEWIGQKYIPPSTTLFYTTTLLFEHQGTRQDCLCRARERIVEKSLGEQLLLHMSERHSSREY